MRRPQAQVGEGQDDAGVAVAVVHAPCHPLGHAHPEQAGRVLRDAWWVTAFSACLALRPLLTVGPPQTLSTRACSTTPPTSSAVRLRVATLFCALAQRSLTPTHPQTLRHPFSPLASPTRRSKPRKLAGRRRTRSPRSRATACSAAPMKSSRNICLRSVRLREVFLPPRHRPADDREHALPQSSTPSSFARPSSSSSCTARSSRRRSSSRCSKALTASRVCRCSRRCSSSARRLASS